MDWRIGSLVVIVYGLDNWFSGGHPTWTGELVLWWSPHMDWIIGSLVVTPHGLDNWFSGGHPTWTG